MKNNKNKLYMKVGVSFGVAILILLVIILSPSFIKKLSGNANSINASGSEVKTGVILNSKYVFDSTLNTITLNIYNGASNSITIDSYVYRQHCDLTSGKNVYGDTCSSASYTKVNLDNPVTINADQDGTITISNASSLFDSRTFPDASNHLLTTTGMVDVGISYTLSDTLYTLSDTVTKILSFDYDKTSNYVCNTGSECFEIGTDGASSLMSGELTPEEFTIKADTSTNAKDVKITLSDNDVYMDKSQNGKISINYSIQSDFAGTWYYLHPESGYRYYYLNVRTLFGQPNSVNIFTYIEFNTTEKMEKTGSVNDNFVIGLYSSKTVTSQLIIPELYFTQTYESTVYSTENATPFSSDKIPQFKLTVYDKTTLKTAIQNALTKLNSLEENDVSLANLQLFQKEISNAVNLYAARSNYPKCTDSSCTMTPVTQSEVDTEVTTLNNFSITYNTKANYTSLKNAYDAAETKLSNGTSYTDASLNALNALITKYNNVQNLSEVYQTKIDNLTTKMVDATNGLVEKDADYTSVDTTINNAKAKENTVYKVNDTTNVNLYTDNSWNTLQTALNAVVRGKKISEQTTVDGYATAINNAINGLVINDANYSDITAIVTTYQSSDNYTKDYYTDASKTSVDDYITFINNNSNKKANEQDVVNGYKTELQNKIASLTLKPAKGYLKDDNYQPFDGALSIEEYKNLFANLNKSYYDADSVKIIEEVISDFDNNTNGINDITIDKQADMDALLKSLSGNLETIKEKQGDYTELCNLYEKALHLDRNIYLQSSLDDLDKALWGLVWDYTISKQPQIKLETENLQTVINNMKLKRANTIELTKVYNEAIVKVPSSYVNFSAVQVHIGSYNDYMGYTIDRQSLVDAEVRSFRQAIDALVLKQVVVPKEASADYTKFKEAIAKLPQDFTPYGDDIVKEAEIVLKDVKALPLDLPVSKQSRVDDVTKEVEDLLYKLNIKLSENITNTVVLSYLKVNGQSVDISTTPFKHTVEYGVGQAKVEVGLASKDSTYKVYGGSSLAYGQNDITITVTTKDNKVYNYKLIVTRKEMSNNLVSITVGDNKITGFKPSVYTYKVKVGKNTDSLDLSAVTEDKNAIVTIKGNDHLKNGSKVTIEVKTKDGTIKVYTLDIQKTGYVNVMVVIIMLAVLVVIATILKLVQKFKKKDVLKKEISLK